jgi:signal transduction histidine kinase
VRALGRDEPWTTLAACVEAVRDSGETCVAQAHDPNSDRSWDITANSYHPNDEPPRVILIARETTSVVRLQDAVRRGEQLSALGELVAGVAHEVRNPIFGMQITLEALETTVPRTEDVTDLFAIMRRWLDRLNRLMESLLAYGRTWTIDLKPGSLADVLQQSLEGITPIMSSTHVDVRSNIDVSRPMLMDASRLVHAFENLLTNAIQHTDDRGAIELTAFEADGFLECAIRDHGPGFAAADLPKVFEPFFTRRRGGTGLGLAIVQRIVDEHGGTLHAGNAATGGAIVTVRFPVYQATIP